MRIDKLRQLKHSESFLQIDFTQGFKYIDKAGEVINLFADSESRAKYNMTPDRLVIESPSDNMTQLKVSFKDFWCHFGTPKSFNEAHTKAIAQDFSASASEVLKIIEPGRMVRLGWRVNFLYEFNKKVEGLNKVVLAPRGRAVESVIEVPLRGDVQAVIRLKLLEKKDASKNSALLFDIDCFAVNDFDREDIPSQIEMVRSSFFSKEILEYVNSVMKGY